jgi:hypothetical protein
VAKTNTPTAVEIRIDSTNRRKRATSDTFCSALEMISIMFFFASVQRKISVCNPIVKENFMHIFLAASLVIAFGSASAAFADSSDTKPPIGKHFDTLCFQMHLGEPNAAQSCYVDDGKHFDAECFQNHLDEPDASTKCMIGNNTHFDALCFQQHLNEPDADINCYVENK